MLPTGEKQKGRKHLAKSAQATQMDQRKWMTNATQTEARLMNDRMIMQKQQKRNANATETQRKYNGNATQVRRKRNANGTSVQRKRNGNFSLTATVSPATNSVHNEFVNWMIHKGTTVIETNSNWIGTE